MKRFIIFCTTFICYQFCFGQDSLSTSLQKSQTDSSLAALNQNDSPRNAELHTSLTNQHAASVYKTKFVTDGLIIAGAVGTTLLGYELIQNKKDLTMEQLAGKTKDKLPFFDRGNAGYYSTQDDKDSYILFDAAYAIPLAMIFINKNERSKAGQLIVLYIETVGITGAMYTLTAGLVYRSRPFVYGDKAPLKKRLDKGGQRSFYGGHVATTAATTFLTAQLFHDFNPHSKLQPYLWGGASALTVLMGYMRYKAGYHFLSDCVLSGIIGGATGILVPNLHKSKKFKNLSMFPEMGEGYKGLALTYHF
jgi:membrane-associated phospholipid phosphatase